ncbi:fimbrial isopeptide formation D2 domain-containing protein/adhesin isopeptide-forming domain-containing protein, sspB-C2 type [Bifidobacterium bohemicum]|uniref:Putative phage tail component, N-terminal domain protein n=1 Tax=Bifidobacterium bohemicum DSM 22767 TaxID=1437606 RepID=A0A086ZH47_9BIFI|nr:adhesin isopeptide-forming adherence domain-containing protein [Bifidobacterium bohemicum]KFI45847.1 putative phage tail component, N-terminal domain protein [Bifidobacterium bohemicum DSM 22767]SCC09486.1 fimbrial isopeptide formation D2 domain-containing protein/adhesin isopeptide-forming domain-containing protein, sspB-C2 type [Bifidobacterium bohemicum]
MVTHIGLHGGGLRGLVAFAGAVLASAAVALCPVVAYASGGAGSGGSGVADGSGGVIKWTYRDSFGEPTVDNVMGVIRGMGMKPYGSAASAAVSQAVDSAVGECRERYAAEHPGQGDAGCRLVSVGAIYTPSPDNAFTGNTAGFKQRQWADAWNAETRGKTYNYKGVPYTTGYAFSDGSTTINSLVARETVKDVAVVVVVLNQYEPPVDVPPAPPEKTVRDGVSADSMTNRTVVSSGTGSNGRGFVFSDSFDSHGQAYTVSNQRVVDATVGRDVSDRFVFDTADGATPAGDVAHATWRGGALPDGHTFEWSLDVTVRAPSTSRVDDRGHAHWKGKSRSTDQDTPSRGFPTWKPSPDKSWVKLDGSGKWQAVVDPSRSNATGADNMKFLDGDRVASVVNGTVDAHLIDAPTALSLADDWSKADYLVDPAKVGDIKVFEADAQVGGNGHYERASIDDATRVGRDVTAMFEVTVDGSKAVARARTAYLGTLKGRATPLQVTLLVPMTVDFAHGKGAAQARKDHGKQPGDELTFCDDESGRDLTNGGSETIGGQKVPTNEPRICGYVPPVRKDVVGEAGQGGDQSGVDGKVVYPGQKVEYQLDTQPHLPADLAYQVKSVSFTDQYDQYLEVDKQTFELMDLEAGRSIGKSKYDTHWDDVRHLVRVDIKDAALVAQWRAGAVPRLQLRFEGRVRIDAPTDRRIENRWILEVNNSVTPSNTVFNLPPNFRPVKRNNKTNESGAAVSIDGRTLMVGDTGEYELELDAAQSDLAYRVWRLGIIDDVDDEYLRIDASKIKITGDDNRDYSDRFNVAQERGVFYMFAKTVNTFISATGETVSGDPQPANLDRYAHLTQSDHDPLRDPAIDQTLLGHVYRITLPYRVIKASAGHVVHNVATQVVNGQSRVSNEVNNPIGDMKPHKDVVERIGTSSINGGKVELGERFFYRIDSSVLPAHRAYPQVREWIVRDKYDRSADKYTKVWSVVAARRLIGAGGAVLAEVGQPIAGNDVDAAAFGGELFTIENSETDGLCIKPTERYLALVSEQEEREQAWTAYVQFERIAPADEVHNRFTETINSVDRVSNVVHTSTPVSMPLPSDPLPKAGSSVLMPLIAVLAAILGAGVICVCRRGQTVSSN